MSIVTISRGSYSWGKEIAEKVASELGYGCISREILLEASKEFNIPEIKLVRALHDAPSVLERFTHGKARYLCQIRKSLLQHLQKDNVVYHGLAGHFFLMNVNHVFKVRITADIQERINEEVRRENISEEEALYILKKDDYERRKWGLQIHGLDTWDSRLYDMTLHIGLLSVDDAVDIICHTVLKPVFKTTQASQKKIRDMLLSAKVQVAIINILPTARVEADNGIVRIGDSKIRLRVNKDTLRDLIKVAEQVEGVTKVDLVNVTDKRGHDMINPFHNA
ncbi:MAG: cytidylate kinase-like family protein [Desulfosalsimonadaceae bacterium]